MTIEQVEEYIEREWNHSSIVPHERVITDVPGCARFVVYSQQYSPESSLDNMICYWFRKS